MDDYGMQDTSNIGNNYESNSYNYSDGNYQGYTHQQIAFIDTSNFCSNYESNSYNCNVGNYQGYTHHYDIDKSNDFSPTQQSKSAGSSDQNNISTNTYASSNNDSDFADTVKYSTSFESQESTPQSETENLKLLDQENFNIDSANQKDENQSIINQESKANEGKLVSESIESTDDSDCCYCKSEPTMCLAAMGECFCL